MPIPGGSNDLYFASGIDNSGLRRDSAQAVGIIGGMASQISKKDVFAGLAIAASVAFAKVSKEMKAFSQEFEHSMKEVQTISQAVQGDFDGFSQSIIDMTTGVPQSANELSKAYYQIVSAGYDGAAGLALLQTSAEAAVGGVTDVTTAADGLTTVMNAWKISAANATQVSDIFFNTVKLGKTTMGELAANIAQVAPLAAAYGVGVEQIFSSTATLTKQGTTTSMAMTQLRQALIAVNEELGQGWSETMTLQEAFREIADRAVETGKDIKELTGRVEGAMAIMSMTGKNAKMAADDLKSYGDAVGSSNAAFGIMVEDSVNQSKLLKNNLMAALKPLGDFWTGKSTEFARSMNEAFKSGQIEKFGKFVATTATALVAYQLTLRGVALTTKIFTKATMASATALKGVKAAFISNPFGLVAAGLAALIVALHKVKQEAHDFKEEFESIEKSAKMSFSDEIVELEKLKIRLEEVKGSREDEQKLIKTINSKYGDHLDNLLDEKTAYQDLKTAIDDVVISMERQMEVEILMGKAKLVKSEMISREDLLKEVVGEYEGQTITKEIQKELDKRAQEILKREYSGQVLAGVGTPFEYLKKKLNSDYQEYLEDYDKLIGDVRGIEESILAEKVTPAGDGSTGSKLLDLEGLDKEIEKAEKAYQEIEKLRKAGLYDESKDLYSYYTKYGNTFDEWLLTMKAKYKDFADQLKEINLNIADFIINDTGVWENSVDTVKISEGFKNVGTAIINQINDEIKDGIKVDIKVPEKEVERAKQKFNLIGLLFTEEELQDLEYNINQFGHSLSNLGSMVSRFDQQAGESVRLLGQMVSNAGAIVNFASSGDVFALMNGIIGIADGIVGFINAVSGKEAKEALKAEEIERQAYKISIAVESINRALAEQYNILAKLNGAAWITGAKRTIDEINKAFSALESQMQNINIELDLPGYTGPAVTLETEGWGAEDFEDALRQYGDIISPESRAEVQSFLDQLSDLQQEADDLRIEIKLETVGFSMDSLVDDVMSMFDQMKDGAVDFGDTFEEVMQKALLNSFQQTQVTRIMQDFYDELYTAMESPVGRADRRDSYGGISPDEFAELEESWNAKNDSLQSQYEFMLSFMEKMGMDIGTGPEEPGDDPNSLSGSIRRSLTEDTGSRLAGNMTNMMLTMKDMAGYQADMVDHLAGIENNTSYNQHLAAIDSNIREIRTQLTP